jgi:hypothetical protein
VWPLALLGTDGCLAAAKQPPNNACTSSFSRSAHIFTERAQREAGCGAYSTRMSITGSSSADLSFTPLANVPLRTPNKAN